MRLIFTHRSQGILLTFIQLLLFTVYLVYLAHLAGESKWCSELFKLTYEKVGLLQILELFTEIIEK